VDLAVISDQTFYGIDREFLDTLRDNGLDLRIIPKDHDIIDELNCLVSPVAVIFVFDYVSSPGLVQLRETMGAFPVLPALMVTAQHSDELAIWAFRARVWDYFYTPVDRARLRQVLSMLRDMRRSGAAFRSSERRPIDPSPPIPLEYRVADRGVTERALDTALSYIRKNYHRKILQKDIAAACDMSTFQFSRLFRERFGATFQEYVLRVRIDKARALLRNPSATVTDACFNCGFNDPSYFTRAFSKTTGCTPSEYKARFMPKEERIPETPAEGPVPRASRAGELDFNAIDGSKVAALVHQYGNA